MKTYVLDTNVLLSDSNSIFSFQEHDLIIPLAVLEELDRHKSRPDDVGRNARQVNRLLDDMRSGGNLFVGVPLPSGGRLRIVAIDKRWLASAPVELQTDKVDNLIIALMVHLTGLSGGDPPILVSKDVNVRIKCDGLNVRCEDYRKMRVEPDPQKFYRGVEVIDLPEDVIDDFYVSGRMVIEKGELGGKKLHPNQVIVIKNVVDGQTTKSAVTKYVGQERSLVPISKIDHAFGLKPRNKEQSFSLDLLFDPGISVLTLVGPSGCVDPETQITVKLSEVMWDMPVPDNTYNHVHSENEQDDSGGRC